MKNIERFILLCLWAFGVCLNSSAQIQPPSAPDPTAQTPATPPPAAPEDGVTFRYHGAPLETVLAYMSKAAGYTIYLRPGVTVSGTVDAWSDQPLSGADAVDFLKTVLSDHGLSVVQTGRTLAILRTSDAAAETPIHLGADPEAIPDNAEVVTQIIPVRNLNPVELNRVLPALLPAATRIEVNESASSLIITDTQASVRRAARIISELDSVNASANTLKVYTLRYGDAKALSDIIKEVFSPADAARGGANGNGTGPAVSVGFPGRRGGFPGLPGLSPGNNSESGQTPPPHVSTTADEHANAVIVSAPETMLAQIDRLVATLDVAVSDETVTEIFHLVNADCTETAALLQQLYPDEDTSADAGGTRTQFTGQGNRGAQGAGARPGTTGGSAGSDSSRLQKLGRVLVVPDPRTSSLVVNAAEPLMASVRYIIADLDKTKGNTQEAFVVHLENANPWDVQTALLDLYPTMNTSTASTTSDPLKIRDPAMWNSAFSGTSANAPGGIGGTPTGATRANVP